MPVDHSNDLLLVTCASGKQAGHLLPHLVAKWKRLRLVVHSSSSQQRLKENYPNAEVIKADLAEPHEASLLFRGVTAVYHIGPSFHPRETQIGYNMIDAAIMETKHGRFKHFVFSSVINSQLQKLMNHDCKRYVEEYLMESGLNYTILQPTHFMDLFPIQEMLSQEKPMYEANWSVDIPFSFLDLQDFGEASAAVLNQREKHYLAQYNLVSTERPLPYREFVGIVSKEIGKTIEVRQKPYEDAVVSFLNMLFGSDNTDPRTRDTAQRIILYYNNHGLRGNSNALQWLLGRKPTPLAESVRMRVAIGKGSGHS